MIVQRQGEYNRLGVGSDVDINGGPLAGILVTYKGTNNALQTLTLADLGIYTLKYRGAAIHQARFAEVWLQNGYVGGLPEFASAVGGAFRATIFIPLRYGSLHTDNPEPNVVNVSQGEMKLFLPGVSAVVAAVAIAEVSLVLDYSGVSRYLTRVHQTQEVLTAVHPTLPSVPNLRYLMLQRPQGVGTLPGTVEIATGRRQVYSGEWAQLEAYTDLTNHIEAAASATVFLPLGGPTFGTWVDGRYKTTQLGANPLDTQFQTMFGAQALDNVDFALSVERARGELSTARQDSASPPSADVAPVVPPTVSVNVNAAFSAPRPASETAPVGPASRAALLRV